ncbi:MAG: zinc-binding alcohol dehydrogenase [Candidatus Bathyarchaeia archaeon]
MQGKRVVFKEKGSVAIEDFDLKRPEPGQVLISTISTLISPGTEKAYLMALPNTPGVFPQYPGYSNSGVVASVGNEASRFKVGNRVVSRENHASYVVAPEDEVIEIPENLSFDEASFFALGSIALQGIRKAQIELGESVVVLGQGLVGILALQLAKLSGGFPVIGVDLYDYRLRISSRCGADYTFNPLEANLEKSISDATYGKGANVVIEATGNPEIIPIALKLAGDYGRVIILGSPRGESRVNFYSDVHRMGICIIGAHDRTRPRYESFHGWWTSRDDSSLILKLIERGLLKVRDLITLKISFQRAEEAYDKLVKSEGEVLGVILDWKMV